MNQEIEMTVCCLAYNHKKYIKKAIDSILKQKTKFRFEVLINDDASTDGTTDIIKEYERKYPDVVKGIYHEQNQYSLGKIVFLQQFGMSRGKYIATCECDDYWSDENKLQRQYEIMESNPDISLCTHSVRHVQEDGSPKNIIQPSFLENGKIDGDRFIQLMLTRKEQSIFHYSSYCFRKKYVKELIENTPEFLLAAPVGDIFLQLYFGCCGNIYYIKEEMSHYRRNSVGSWTLTNRVKEKKIKHWQCMISAYKLFNDYTRNKYRHEIDEYTTDIGFQINLIKNDLKKICSDKQRFAQLSALKKVRVFLCYYFPILESLYIIIKKMKR